MMKFPHLHTRSCMKFACFSPSFRSSSSCLYPFFAFCLNPLWIQLSYFILISFVGFLVLKIINPKSMSNRPKDLDVFFMSASAATVSSMSTVEKEVFSNAQLVILSLLMLVGGELFISLLGLQLMKIKLKKHDRIDSRVDPVSMEDPAENPSNASDHIEMGVRPRVEFKISCSEGFKIHSMGVEDLKYSCIRYLGFVVLGFLLLVHVIGSSMVFVYLRIISSARDVLKNKGIKLATFSIFATISTFANCGFIPTNENMIVFNWNSGLLLILIPLILVGNTLFPPCLRVSIWVLWKLTKRAEFDYMLKNPKEMEYYHLLPNSHCVLLCLTVSGFIVVQLILFCCLEWHSETLIGLNSYQKIIGALFQSVNSRHSGESVVDLSVLSPAILVLYVVMMYLPPYTSFLPSKGDLRLTENCKKGHKRRGLLKDLSFSNLSYLATFIILICITEREKMSNDPLNFNVLNVVIEVVSAYGSVGFSTGYVCRQQLKPDSHCKDAWFGFVGRWSNKGKLILIMVMFYGRLKKFNMGGEHAWKLN